MFVIKDKKIDRISVHGSIFSMTVFIHKNTLLNGAFFLPLRTLIINVISKSLRPKLLIVNH